MGDTLDAFLPEKPTIKTTLSGVEIEGVEYLAVSDLTEEEKEGKRVQDVILLGEVRHSPPSQGSALLIVRSNRDIRRGDNFVSSAA